MGRHDGAELLNRGAKRDFALCPVGAPRGRLGTLRLGNSVNMPSVLANASTDPSREYTLFFQKRKIRDFAGPVGDTPKVTLRKSCLAPAEYSRFHMNELTCMQELASWSMVLNFAVEFFRKRLSTTKGMIDTSNTTIHNSAVSDYPSFVAHASYTPRPHCPLTIATAALLYGIALYLAMPSKPSYRRPVLTASPLLQGRKFRWPTSFSQHRRLTDNQQTTN